MNSFAALLLSLALLAPPVVGAISREDSTARVTPEPDPPAMSFQRDQAAPFGTLEDSFRPEVQNQVRIERRVIIRIAPSPRATREQLLGQLPRRAMPTRYQEERLDACVPIEDIAGVAPVQGDRLLLFMRDRRILSAALERACRAQAFYSGFYVERSEDGMLCSGRDKLQSRAGASCEVDRLNRLVAVSD